MLPMPSTLAHLMKRTRKALRYIPLLYIQSAKVKLQDKRKCFNELYCIGLCKRLNICQILRCGMCVQLSESDQELYRDFPIVVSERWQQEIAETIFDVVNQETDKLEQKRKQKQTEEEEESGE